MNYIKKEFLEKSTNEEMLDIVECITRAESHGLLVEVVYTALKEMKETVTELENKMDKLEERLNERLQEALDNPLSD